MKFRDKSLGGGLPEEIESTLRARSKTSAYNGNRMKQRKGSFK